MAQLVFIFCLFALPCFASPVTPSNARSGTPLALHHLSVRPENAILSGERSFAVTSSMTSNAIKEENYTIDGESFEATLSAAVPLGDSLSLALHLPYISLGGGSADSFIDSWHDFFNLPDGDRPRLGKDEFVVGGTTDSGESFDFDSGGGFTNPELGLSYALYRSERSAVQLRSNVLLPSLSSHFGQQGIDSSLGLDGACTEGKWSFFAGAHYLFYSDTSYRNLRYRAHRVEGYTGLGYSFTDTFSLYVNVLAGSALVENLREHDDYTLYVDMGGTIAVSENTMIDITVRENPGPQSSSADVSGVVALRVLL